MSVNSWVNEIENKVFTIVKAKTYTKLKTKYPKITFTTSNRNDKEAEFPTVYLHEIACREIGMDLSNDVIQCISETISVEVYSNKSQKEAKDILSEIITVMKELRYTVEQLPIFDNGTTYYSSIARFTRRFGNEDII